MRGRVAFTLLLLVAAAALVWAPPVQAQERIAFEGRVEEAQTGAAISGATVYARSSDGQTVGGTFSGSDGAFVLRVPAGTLVTVVAEAIGYDAVQAGPLDPGGLMGPLLLTLERRPVVLDGLEVRGVGPCPIDPAAAPLVHSLWTDARVALQAAVVAGDEGLVHFRTRVWSRILDDRGQLIRTAEEREVEALRQPFHTLPPEELARDGYMQEENGGWVLFAPAANVLLSESFADTHCFSLERGGLLRNRGMVRLAFEPIPGHPHVDIQGVLWVDERSGQLRRIEYEYVREGERLTRAARAGGEIHLRALPEGPWIVDRWHIRTPVPGLADELGRILRYNFEETGGEVVLILGAQRS